MSSVDLTRYDFSEVRGRHLFINEVQSGIYTGENVEGEDVIVLQEMGVGMVVKTRHHAKPMWYECVEYDENGSCEGVTYEHI